MRRTWPWLALETAARRTMRSPTTLVITAALYVIIAGTITTLWRVAAESNGGAIGGYDGRSLTWYLAFSEAVTVCLSSRLIERIGEEIGDGTVSVELLRPASVLGVRICTEVGSCLPRLAVCGIAALVLATVTGGSAPDGAALALVVPAMVLAVVCNLIAQHAVAALSFWIRDSRSSWFLYQKLVFILGGMLIPLQLLPSVLRAICFALPFVTMAYVPARLVSGHFEPWLLALQIGWLAVLWATAVAVYSAGERRLQVVGG